MTIATVAELIDHLKTIDGEPRVFRTPACSCCCVLEDVEVGEVFEQYGSEILRVLEPSTPTTRVEIEQRVDHIAKVRRAKDWYGPIVVL